MITRELASDGTLRLSAAGCRYTFARLGRGTLLLAIAGKETGELGAAPIGEVAVEAAHHAPLHLLIDMRHLGFVSEAVSADWTAWFQANQEAIRRVDVLAPEVFVRLVVAVSQVFSRTGDMIRIHTQAVAFE
jgi:hypothetical protein